MGRLSLLGAGPGGSTKSGFSLSFNGTDALVSRAAANVFNMSTAYWVSAWVKGVAQTDKRIYAEGSSSSNSPFFGMGTGSIVGENSKVTMFIRNDANGTVLSANSTTVVFNNTWHNLIWVDNAGTAALYVDGVLDATSFNYTPTGAVTVNRTAAGALLRAASSAFFAGNIDEVVTGTGALSGGDISAIQTHVYPTATIKWLFDEGSGTTATDTSGNGRDGTITNATYTTDIP